MQLARRQAFASARAFVRFGLLTAALHTYQCLASLHTTAWLAKYDGMGRNSTPFFFSFHRTCPHSTCRVLLAIIHAAGILLTAIPIDIVLVTSYCTTSHSLSLRELHKQSHKTRQPSRHLLLAVVLAAHIHTAILTDIVLVASYCTSHCLSL